MSRTEAIKTLEEESKCFANTICKACGFCEAHLSYPFFCLKAYKSDKSRFLNIIKHLKSELTRDKKTSLKKYSSFVGFCGLFCNTNTCPHHDAGCKFILKRLRCYSMFVNQWGSGILTDEVRKEIVNKYNGSDMSRVGSQFVAAKDPFVGLKKGKKRAIKKAVSKAHKDFSAASKTGDFSKSSISKVSNISRKPTTTIFYNDNDKVWEGEVKAILGGL